MNQNYMRQLDNMYKMNPVSMYKTFSAYASDMQLHHRFSSIAAAEKAAEDMGYILVPATCLSWRKRAQLGDARRIKIHESFYAITQHELTDLERTKFFKYLDKLGADKNDLASK